MTAAELKKALERYTKADLVSLATEIYRVLPKKERDAYSIDGMIADFPGYLVRKKAGKTEPAPMPIATLEPQVLQFLDYAHKQYYFAPNRYVRKQDRPLWRNIAGGYIKELQRYPADTPEGETATGLLEKLYRTLGYASRYYLFPTESPFRAVSIKQTALLDVIIARRLERDNSPESIRACLKMMVETPTDKNTWFHSVSNIMTARLKTAPMRERARTETIALLEAYHVQRVTLPAKTSMYSDKVYQLEEQITDLLEFLFPLMSALGEAEQAVTLYRRLMKRPGGETPVRTLLLRLQDCDEPALWAREYDKELAKGKDFGTEFAWMRKKIRETGKFPSGQEDMPEE